MTRDRIVAFYQGGTDDRGRTLEEILGWSDDALESVHDYIQWVFPTIQPSGVNQTAPLVTDATVAAFQTTPSLREALGGAFERMLSFYGLRGAGADSGRLRIEIDEARFPARAPLWLQPCNHNHLRLTRIMKSLSALGLKDEARALQHCLTTSVHERAGRNRITRETYEFWMTAVP